MTVATLDRTEQTQVGSLTVTGSQDFWSDEQRAVLAQIGVENAPRADLKMFLQQCQRTGLDPWSRQIYMIGRNQWDRRTQGYVTKWNIQTSIDGFRVIAERSGKYAGQTPVEWCGKDGQWQDVWLSDQPPAAARVGVYRSDFSAPLYATAHFAEYAPRDKKSGNLTGLWATLSAHMIAKVAEALALRKAFPNDMSGLYTGDEMAAADNNDAGKPNVIDQSAPATAPAPAASPEGNRQRAIERARSERVAKDGEPVKAGEVAGEVVENAKPKPDEHEDEVIADLKQLGQDAKAAYQNGDREDLARMLGEAEAKYGANHKITLWISSRVELLANQEQPAAA